MNNDSKPSFPLFTEAGSAETVNARIGPDVDPRTRQIAEAVVRHLHAAVKEIEPTHQEWLAAIKFLTDTGHKCTDWRQEFIMLSDVLGVSMLVDAINHRRPGQATENTILGPFFVEGVPTLPSGADICLDHKGEPLVVRARVTDIDGQPVAGATIDANGAAGGGSVRFGGGAAGKDPTIADANAVWMDLTAQIEADALVSGNGGHIVAFGTTAARLYGTFSARGGAQGGNGGLIETSGGTLDVGRATVDASAPMGHAGTWLLDPVSIEICASATCDTGTSPGTVSSR